MKDNKHLVEIWKELNKKKHVIVFVDDDEDEDAKEHIDDILNWFEPITAIRLNNNETKIKNETFILFRKLLENMPAAMLTSTEEYSVKYLDNKTLKEISEDLNHDS